MDKYDLSNSSLPSSSSEESEDGSPRGHSVIDSASYTVPGNPRAPRYEGNLTPYAEPLVPIPRKRTFVPQEDYCEPSTSRLSRRDTPIWRDKDTQTPSRRQQKAMSNIRLPGIVHSDTLRSDEIIDGLTKDGLVPESQFIRHTRSGVAYHFMYGPPTRKPRRLPRIVSEGAVRKGREEKYLIDSLDYRPRSPRKQMKQKCYCSGGRFTEDIRCAAVKHRQQREQKNIEKVRSKLHEQNEKIAMLTGAQRSGTPFTDRAARVQEVKAKQDEIRQQEAMRVMENFMKQKNRKH